MINIIEIKETVIKNVKKYKKEIAIVGVVSLATVIGVKFVHDKNAPKLQNIINLVKYGSFINSCVIPVVTDICQGTIADSPKGKRELVEGGTA